MEARGCEGRRAPHEVNYDPGVRRRVGEAAARPPKEEHLPEDNVGGSCFEMYGNIGSCVEIVAGIGYPISLYFANMAKKGLPYFTTLISIHILTHPYIGHIFRCTTLFAG